MELSVKKNSIRENYCNSVAISGCSGILILFYEAQFSRVPYSMLFIFCQSCAYIAYFIMAALRSRCGHYIFALWFLLSSFFLSSPNLSRRILDVYHTSTRSVALVHI